MIVAQLRSVPCRPRRRATIAAFRVLPWSGRDSPRSLSVEDAYVVAFLEAFDLVGGRMLVEEDHPDHDRALQRLGRERVGRRDLGQPVEAADHHRLVDPELVPDHGPDDRADLQVGPNDEVAALKVRPDIAQPGGRQTRTQRGHRNLVASPEIDRPQESEPDRRLRQLVRHSRSCSPKLPVTIADHLREEASP